MNKTKQEQVNSKILYKSLESVLHDSMIPYTEHVVMDRALPRIEDGLKPVQRRILYSMMELGLTPDKPYRKSARIVGDCMGKYHPHGDSSVYDAMVRMAQDFSLNAPLVDGHGNFGSIDGDSAAAMRYTEARMSPLALELLRDLDKNTISWSLNFDDTLKEPIMLPGRFPNLLVNGATGIAVGVATNIPPHNLEEVIDGVCAYIKNPNIKLSKLMSYIKAPDFPTGGIIIAGEGIKEAYKTGKGKIFIKSKVDIETNGDKSEIVIKEIPYQVNKSQLLQKIADLKEKEKGILSYIGEITDESDRNGMRAVIKIKKDGNPQAILDYLFKYTNLQISYGINMVAIAGGKPKLMNLLDIISYYVDYQVSVIVKRTKFDLDKAKTRACIIEGLLIAIHNIDEVIKIIKKSQSYTDAKINLIERFSISELQAQAILDMRIARLVNLEVKKLEDEYSELQEKIKKLTDIYNSRELQNNLIISEMKEIKRTFGHKRKSNIIYKSEESESKVVSADAFEYIELNHIVLSADYRLKRMVIKNIVPSKISATNKLFEINQSVIKVNSNEQFFAFTNKGNCVKLKVKEIPEQVWKGKGELLCEINKSFKFNEHVIKILPILKEVNAKILIFTKKGLAKSTRLDEFMVNRTNFIAISLKENDEVINVQYDNKNENLVTITKNGYSLKFNKKELPIQKRNSVGTKIQKLQGDDEIVFAGLVQKFGSMTIITNSGNAKKVPIGDYEITGKYRRGLKTISLKNQNDKIIFAKFSLENFDFITKTKDKCKLFNSSMLHYDKRISKGRIIEKSGIDSVFYILDKTKI